MRIWNKTGKGQCPGLKDESGSQHKKVSIQLYIVIKIQLYRP